MFRTATQTIVVDKVKRFGVWRKATVFNPRPSQPVLAYWRDHGRHSITICLDEAPVGVSRLEFIRSEVAGEIALRCGLDAVAPAVELGVKVARKWR